MTDRPATAPSRRTLLKAAGAASVAAAARALIPGGAWAQAAGPETTKAVLGFIALTDAAPLIVAKEKGLFAKHGMPDVEVAKQASWGTVRDNLVLGSAGGGIDGAHILTPMPYLISAGTVTQNNVPTPMRILARLNLDSQCISAGMEFADLKLDVTGAGFAEAIAAKKAAGGEPKAAMTFPGGTHDLWIRYWMAAAGVNPDADISTIVVPPAQMVANMKVGSMDVFCVGEPWNDQTVNQGIGYTVCNTGELWAKHPEKAMGMRADWIEANPRATQAILMAVMEAQMWCDKAENRAEVAKIISGRAWVGAPVKDTQARLEGRFDYGLGKVVEDSPHIMKFWRDHASYPFRSHDLWFLTENKRWGYLPADFDSNALVAEVNREDLWREAAAALGVPAEDIPVSTSRGVETFFDGVTFDPENPEAYLERLSIKRLA
jgi:nitrate/nitrite transport system substrate-binding protein